MKSKSGSGPSKIALKIIQPRRNDDSRRDAGQRCRMSCSWAEELPSTSSSVTGEAPQPPNPVFRAFMGLVIFIGTVAFIAVVSIMLAHHRRDASGESNAGSENSTNPSADVDDSLGNDVPLPGPGTHKTCRIVVLFAKTGVEASTDAPYQESWTAFRLTPMGTSLSNICDLFEFDARSDPEVVLDIVSNFVSNDKRSLVVVGVGDYALGGKLTEILQNSSAVVYSPQNVIPDSTQILNKERDFQLTVDAVLTKASGMRATKLLPIVCDNQSKKFDAFLTAAADSNSGLEILSPITAAVSTVENNVPDVQKTIIAAFCGRDLPSALLWAKLSAPRLITRPWVTLDAYGFKEIAEDDVVARRVGPMVGLFTPVLLQPNCDEEDKQQTFGKFLRNLVKLIPKAQDSKQLILGFRTMMKIGPIAETEEVAIASMPLLNRKSGKAVLVRNQAWSIDSYLQFRHVQGRKFEFEGARVPALGSISRSNLEHGLDELAQVCDTFWVSIQAGDPFSCAMTSDTFMMGGTTLKDIMGFPEQILFLADGKFKGELVCLKGNQPADKFKIHLTCSPTLDVVCKNISLTLDGRESRAMKVSNTAIATRNQLTRLGQFVHASSPCVGVGIFCVLCLNGVGGAVTEMTMTACSAACLVAGTVTCVGFVVRQSGDLLRDATNIIG